MEESEDNMSADDVKKVDRPSTVKIKPKKRSLVERELETNLTARVTSPVSNGDGSSTSRYGRARRLKTNADFCDSRKIMLEVLKTSQPEKSPVKVQSPVYKMHASNSPIRTESPKTAPVETYLENQIESIYQENISLSRFGVEEVVKQSPGKKYPKVYIRKDLIQKRDTEETVILIKNMFSPVKSAHKSSNSHLSNILERSSDKFDITSTGKVHNGYIDNTAVVKTLDFDSKKKKINKEIRVLSKSDLFDLEAKCPYQVGDLAWARMGTFPFWPCIVTRDPSTSIFVKKKLFGRIVRDIIHVTFFGDNGRRGWIVDNMLRRFSGLIEFETTREKFTPEEKKKDPRLYAAFYVSEKKQLLWNTSVEEAETLLREPKRLRIDMLNDMLEKTRCLKTNTPKTQKSGKITRTDSDVSLSESLYDTLFSEDDGKADDSDRSRNKSRNKSLDVSDVVTACLDNMAAKTGITKIQRQSHMDRWLQKAKSKTPEKTQAKTPVPNKVADNKTNSACKKKKRISPKEVVTKPYSLRKSTYESQNLLGHQNEHDYSKYVLEYEKNSTKEDENKPTTKNKYEYIPLEESGSGIGVITNVVSLAEKNDKNNTNNDAVLALVNDDFIVTGSDDTKDIVIENQSDDMASYSNDKNQFDSNLDCNEDCEMELCGDNVAGLQNNENTDEIVVEQETLYTSTTLSTNDQHVTNNNIFDKSVINEITTDKYMPNTILDDNDANVGEEIISQDNLNDHNYESEQVINSANYSINIATLNEYTDLQKSLNKTVRSISADQDISEKSKLYEVVDMPFKNNLTVAHNLPVTDTCCDANVEPSDDKIVATESLLYINENLGEQYLPLPYEEVTYSNKVASQTAINSNDIGKVQLVFNEKLPDDESSIVEKFHNRNELLVIQNDSVIENFSKEAIQIYKENIKLEPKPLSEIEDERNINKEQLENIITDLSYSQDLNVNKNDKSKAEIPSVEIKVNRKKNESYCEMSELPNEFPGLSDNYTSADMFIDEIETKVVAEISPTKSGHHRKNDDEYEKNKITEILENTDIYTSGDNATGTVDNCKAENPSIEKGVNEPNIDNEHKNTKRLDKHTDSCKKAYNTIDTVDTNFETKINLKNCENPNSNVECKLTKTTEEFSESTYSGMHTNNAVATSSTIENNFDADITQIENDDDPNSDDKQKITKTPKKSSNATDSFAHYDYVINTNEYNLNDSVTCSNNEEKTASSKLINDENDKIEDKGIMPIEKKIPVLNISESIKENGFHEEVAIDFEDNQYDMDTASINSEDSEVSVIRIKRKLCTKQVKISDKGQEDPDFLKYLELRQDAVMDEHPELNEDEIIVYLHQTWVYENNNKSNLKKSDDLQKYLVKGLEESNRKRTLNRSTKTNKERKKKNASVRNVNELDSLSVTSESSGISVKSSEIPSKIPFVLIKQNIMLDQNLKQKDEASVTGNTILVNGTIPENQKTDKIKEEMDLEAVSTKSVDTDMTNKHLHPNTSNSTFESTKYILENECKSAERSKDVEAGRKIVQITIKEELDVETASIDSEASDVPLIYRKLRLRTKENGYHEIKSPEGKIKDEIEADNASINSEDSDLSLAKRKAKSKNNDKRIDKTLEDPEFINYLELRQDALIDENPQLTQDEIANYLYKTWLYEENVKSDLRKTDDIEKLGSVKGLNQQTAQPKKVKRKVKVNKEITSYFEVAPKEKPKRKTTQPYYNEEFSDIEDEIESFEIFKSDNEKEDQQDNQNIDGQDGQVIEIADDFDEVELYFSELTQPKPNIFKGLVREKVCEICEKTGDVVKCKTCHGMFHVDCIQKKTEVIDAPIPCRGRKKKKKPGRRPKSMEDSGSQSDDKPQDISEEQNVSFEDIIEPQYRTVDAESFEAQLALKMKEILENTESINYDSYSSDDGIDWTDTIAGKCEIVDVKLKRRTNIEMEYSDFKCNNCQEFDTPICFVCKSAVSKSDCKVRQRCHVAHCHKYYHLGCLDHWPQTQFNSGEPSKSNKKINEYFEALTCPRHVCHTCVSDDPRGCKTRFSGDKLARCVRCPATYHSFTKCLPAGTQILTGSHIICPRHYEHRPGKVPCHVNTGWCFICALGGSLICCEYCPTSFHAECLNIDPPEGGYMCEDCETGRLPLYGEMVWVKLGHYRWWPGIILHPSEIPANIMAVKHSQGEFVVRFFGQYDHYWVNRGRVFPFQEGDSGRISSQKSKIDAAFTTAMEHAQRACEILKIAEPNEEESLDIASSLLPPHYVKLKVNKPCGSLCGRKVDDPELSLTQCECNPDEEDPCGPYSQCINRMLLTECGPTCRAGDRCNNRAFEKRLYPKLVPYRTPHRGWGLKTLEDIKAGQFVIEYVGELIDEEEFKRRMRRKHEIRDENFYFLTLDKERMIDAGPKGNLARFMNHCCEPNCETQKWTVLGDVRVGLFALHDIPANKEVTFNYNLECAGIEKKRCLCGAKRCSGYIGAKPKQDESQPKKPKMAAKRTYKKRKPEESPSTSKNKPKRPIGRPPKPKELSEIEKDLLIIRNATNGLSSDESSRSLSSEGDRNPKALKRKRVSFSTEEIILFNGTDSPSLKRQKLDEKEVGD